MPVALAVFSAVAGCSSPPVADKPIQREESGWEAGKAQTDMDAEGDSLDARAASDALPFYEPATDLSGKIVSIGASTTTNLVARVAAEFKRMHPGVTLQIAASLESRGLLALLDGETDIVPMSRPLTPAEIGSFVAKYGHPPTEIAVAADALAVYVEKRNPVAGLTLGQLDGIFSRTQRRGGISIETWGQVGLTDEWIDRPIALYGYGTDDGAHRIFQQRVLEGGEFRLSLRAEGGGSSIVQGVATDAGAIGFASNFYAAKRVRAIPLAGADGRFYAPTEENVRSRNYPLIRFLYICVNKPPGQPLCGPAAEFLHFLLSREGQQVVADGGNIPLDAATAAEGRRAMGGAVPAAACVPRQGRMHREGRGKHPTEVQPCRTTH
jgi:phosphate transport system substrate-binding protein